MREEMGNLVKLKKNAQETLERRGRRGSKKNLCKGKGKRKGAGNGGKRIKAGRRLKQREEQPRKASNAGAELGKKIVNMLPGTVSKAACQKTEPNAGSIPTRHHRWGRSSADAPKKEDQTGGLVSRVTRARFTAKNKKEGRSVSSP